MSLHPTFLAISPGILLLAISPTVAATCSAGIALVTIGVLAAKNDLARAHGLDKAVVLSNLSFAIPLGVFGAEHFAAAQDIMQLVPKFMPWHLFWTYFVGCALIAASLSIATKIQVRWSGLLVGIMMLIFVSLMDLPGTLTHLHNRIIWALLCRELSFGSGGWCFAAAAMKPQGARGARRLFTIARVVIGIAAMFYGVEHFLHPLNVPGVPLEKLMPVWIPGRKAVSYLTGAILLVCGLTIVLAKKIRMAATWLGSWILLVVLAIYGPILVASLLDPSTAVKVEGINYFFDTLLYAGTILAVAAAAPAANGSGTAALSQPASSSS